MIMRPCRNRMSRFVAAEMRYFHRPFAMSVLSCCTSIITLVSALLSLLSYVGSSSDDGTGSRGYLNISIGLLITLFAAYIVYIIIKWGRLPSYSLVMSFTAVNYVVSAIGGFLLSRSVLYDMLEESIEGGYEYFLNNILSWSFWAPAAIILIYFAASFVKSKTGNHDGGWWHIIFIILPLSIIPFVTFVMRMEIEKENFVTVTSFSVMVYITIMLSIAARYIVKAVMNKLLTDLPVFEDAVVVKSTYRASDGKQIFWWEKKPPVAESDESGQDADMPVSKLRAFGARFASWFKRIFARSAPPDIIKTDDAASDAAPDKKAAKTPKKDKAAASDNNISQDSGKKSEKDKQKAKADSAKTKQDKQKDKKQPVGTEKAEKADKPKETGKKSKLKPEKQKASKQKKKKTDKKAGSPAKTKKAESAPGADTDIPASGELLIPKSPKLSAILTKLRARNAADSGKDKAKKDGKNTGEESNVEQELSAETQHVSEQQPAAQQIPDDIDKAEQPENDSGEWFAENSEPESTKSQTPDVADGEASVDEPISNESEDDTVSDSQISDKRANGNEISDNGAYTASGAEHDTDAETETAESQEPSETAEHRTDVLLNRVVGALSAVTDKLETKDSEDVKETEPAADEQENEDAGQNGEDSEQPE